MKKLFFLTALVILFFSCGKEDLSTGKETKITFSSFTMGTQDISSESISCLRVLALDNTSTVVRYFLFTSAELTNNTCSITLPIGSYTLAFIANGNKEGEVSCDIGYTLDEVLLKLIREGENYREASDFLTAKKSIQITRDATPPPLSITLERKVGKIRVTLNELNPDIDSIKLELRQAPTTLTFNGKTSGNATIVKKMAYTKGSGNASAEILTFPVVENKAEIGVLYTINQITYRGSMTLSPAVDANRIMSVEGSYQPSKEQETSFTIQDWNGNEISGGSFILSEGDEVVGDDRPVTGNPTGANLLQNAGFELWESNPVKPQNWLYLNAGAHMTATQNNVTKLEGNSSARLEQSTYLYQDIPIVGGECYQIRLRVNATTSAYKWKVGCNWRTSAAATSGQLPASYNAPIQTDELGVTTGWLEPFGTDNKFRAPYSAKYLRIEIRTYSIGNNTLNPNEGVYLDQFEVFLLK